MINFVHTAMESGMNKLTLNNKIGKVTKSTQKSFKPDLFGAIPFRNHFHNGCTQKHTFS